MKTVFLHGLGQNQKDWENVIRLTTGDSECPELFSYQGNDMRHFQIYLTRVSIIVCVEF